MFDKVASWFSAPKQQQPAPATWDATGNIQNQQPTSPDAPSAERIITEQPDSQENMKLRGGGAGDVCCGVCTGLLCFECCEECC